MKTKKKGALTLNDHQLNKRKLHIQKIEIKNGTGQRLLFANATCNFSFDSKQL